jgi:hypothetical protein
MYNDEESDPEEEDDVDDFEDTATILKNMSLECEQADEELADQDKEFAIHEFTASNQYYETLCNHKGK